MKKVDGLNLLDRIFGRRAPETDRERVRNLLVKEVAYASALAGFLSNGVNRGREARITIEIDGTACQIGIQASAKEPLLEYMANWAVREKLAKHVRLDEFDKEGGGGQSRWEQENGSGEFPPGTNTGDVTQRVD